MCLILFAHEAHPRYRLVLAANRDEFYDRPTTPAAWWDDAPDLLAGRDLRSGGTWLGVTRGGRVAAVTNVRDSWMQKLDAPSRGWLVRDFLAGGNAPEAYLRHLASRSSEYNGFNLLVADGEGLGYYTNRIDRPRSLEPGVYGVSNALLDTPWPKIRRGKATFRELLTSTEGPSVESLFGILADRAVAEDADLPDTGVGAEMERMLSPLFIASPRYGTRSSTVLLIDREGNVTFVERAGASDPAEWTESRYLFTIEPAATVQQTPR